MKSLPQLSATVLLTAPLGAWALGLGDIELQSALNQRLRAEIELLSVTQEELDGLRVSLASRETFERYGLDRTAELSTLDFEIGRNEAGRYVVFVTSNEAIADPFLTMLVEARWPRGRLLREYTVLLDPPVFTPGITDEPPVRQAASGTSSSGGGAIERPPVAEDPAPPPAAPASSPNGAAPASSSAASAATDGRYGPVRSAETLWSISSRLRPSDVTVNQMMVALYEANPDAFDDNMNLLLRGATLTVPDRAALTALSPADATAEVSRQESLWRDEVAGAEARVAAESGQGADDAGAAAAAADGPAGADASRQARLRLVPPSTDSVIGADGDGVAAGGGDAGEPAGRGSGEAAAEIERLQSEVATLRGELEENRRLLELRNEELQALQARLAEAESPGEGADAAAAADETDDQVAAAAGVDLEREETERLFVDDEAPEGEAPVEAPDETPESAPDAGERARADETAADGPAAEEPVQAEAASAPAADAQGRPPAARTVAEPSLLSRVLGAIVNPFVVIGLGVGAVLVAALLYLRYRREDADDVTGRWDALEAEAGADEEEVRDPTSRLKPLEQDASLFIDETDDDDADEAAPAAAAGGGAAAAGRMLGDEEVDDTLSSQTVINLDQGDALAEADFHMAYGLYDQAAELVQKALESEPDRRDLKLKLLEVYFVWGNKDAFRDAAHDLKSEIGDGADGDWDKVLIMGKQLCPDDALFAEAAGQGGAVDVDLQATGATELDFAFDEKASDIDLDFSGADETDASDEPVESGRAAGFDPTSSGLDFDLGETGEQLGGDELDAGDEEAAAASGSGDDADFSLDIGASTAAGLEAAFLDPDDEDGQETAHHQGAPAAADEDTAAGTTPDLDLDLDSLGSTQESPTVESPQAGLVDEEDWASALGLGDDPSYDPELEAPTVETAAGSDSDPGSLASTMESPTVEQYGLDSPTMESPTVEQQGPDSPTMESPTVEQHGPDSPTMETPTVESPRPDAPGTGTQQLRSASGETAEVPSAGDGDAQAQWGEHTEEIDLDDLGLSVEDLSGLPDDVGTLPADDGESDTREQPALDVDDALLSATGVTRIGDDDDALEQLGTAVLGDGDEVSYAADDQVGSGTEVLEQEDDEAPAGDTSMLKALDSNAGDAQQAGGEGGLDDVSAALSGGDTVEQPGAGSNGGGVDLDLDDLSAALSGGDTVEQPRASSFESELFGDGDSGSTPVDLDVGVDVQGSDDPTGTEDIGSLDPHTMTEIGTKLDLARAYIDMGDPEGARSILEEVLDEGDAGQRREAQGLIDALAG